MIQGRATNLILCSASPSFYGFFSFILEIVFLAYSLQVFEGYKKEYKFK